MNPIHKMKPKNTKRKTKTASKLSTAASGSTSTTSDQQSNTCREYFKVKKSPVSSGDSKDVPETRGNSVIADDVKTADRDLTPLRPRRSRPDNLKQSPGKHQAASGLTIEDVQMLVEAQGSFEGGVNCPVCGKLYKSKVCFIKHIWEHTIYWDVFDSAKNHERVLSIQAAIILYSGMGTQTNGSSKSDLCNLLVTSPHSPEMKQDKDSGVTPKRDVLNTSRLLALLSVKCADKSPVVVEYERKQSDSAVENSLHNGVAKHTAVVTTNSHSVSSDSCTQTPSTSHGECWQQPSPLVSHLRSEMSPISQAHSTLSSLPLNLLAYPALFLPPAKLQSNPAEMSPREKLQFYLNEASQRPHNYRADVSSAKPFHAAVSSAKPQTNLIRFSPQVTPHYFPTLSFPPLQPERFQMFSSPVINPQTYRTSGVPVLMPATSLPAPQLSSDACQDYKSSRPPSHNTYGTLENNKVSSVSPVKRKHED